MYGHRKGSSWWKATTNAKAIYFPSWALTIFDLDLLDSSAPFSMTAALMTFPTVSPACVVYFFKMICWGLCVCVLCVYASFSTSCASKTNNLCALLHSFCLFCRADRLQGREPDFLENLPFEKIIPICTAKRFKKPQWERSKVATVLALVPSFLLGENQSPRRHHPAEPQGPSSRDFK